MTAEEKYVEFQQDSNRAKSYYPRPEDFDLEKFRQHLLS